MHILHVVQIYHPAPSGAARYFVEIGERLVAEGHRVTVLTTDAFDLEHFWMPGKHRIADVHDEHAGVQVHRLRVQRLPGPPILYPLIRRLMVETGRLPGSMPLLGRMARLTPRLPELAATLAAPEFRDVTLVHSTNITLDFMLLPVAAWADQRSIPHLITPFVHLGEPGNRQVLRYYSMPHQIDLLRRSAAVITQTGLEQDFLQRAGVPAAQMQTIGVGINPAELGGDGTRFRCEQHIQGPIVLSAGTAAYDKGTIHVVEAMQRLWAAGSPATWVQVGSLMDHFQHFAARLPAADRARTRILGFVPDQVRRDAFAAADLFVMPSRTDSFGIVYLEAWGRGIPVIGARAGGVPEVIRHRSDGLLVEFGDVAGLARSIAHLLNDRELARAMGELGRRKVLRELTWERKYQQVRELYVRHAACK
jgi:glycosyltransferase involved in cell wall biosynthesis